MLHEGAARLARVRDKVISQHHSIIWFLGWRCVYAEIVNSRVENRTLDLERALKRAISMLIGRLKAYGKKWREWVVASRHRTTPNTISQKHRNKKLLRQGAGGENTKYTKPFSDWLKGSN